MALTNEPVMSIYGRAAQYKTFMNTQKTQQINRQIE